MRQSCGAVVTAGFQTARLRQRVTAVVGRVGGAHSDGMRVWPRSIYQKLSENGPSYTAGVCSLLSISIRTNASLPTTERRSPQRKVKIARTVTFAVERSGAFD